MAEQAPDEPTRSDTPEARQLGRDFAQLFDQVIELALGELFTAVAERGLGFAELLVLRALANDSETAALSRRPRSHLDLVRTTGLSASMVREVVPGLEGQKLIASSPTDTISLTTEGRILLRDLRGRRLDALTAFVHQQGRGERLRLAGALHLLDARFDSRLRPEPQ